ncbi:putative DHHC palmitoyltransferase [Hamiltosporidium tvaerminnensis]|uniref:Palmitoyltransferase n=1 Tax=Hamiltosporidium tvaerminnensis TaxID=1176355 RepID=A0A4Q9M0S3_9MICR|nr:putative DHHC palmitoyltransferase [Hamiltosporidium tvaerminnensis]
MKTVQRVIVAFEYILITTTVCYIFLSLYDTLKAKGYITKAILLYFLLVSSYYYLSILVKKDVHILPNTEIKGLCRKCNKLRCTRTFHCDTCNLCFYKRDHHCPWLAKCISSSNYREYYFFILFTVIYLSLKVLCGCLYVNQIVFLNNYLLTILSFFFIWTNFLLFIDKTSIEYYKSRKRLNVSRYFWQEIDFCVCFDRLYEVLFDREIMNVLIMFFPFLQKRTSIIEGSI